MAIIKKVFLVALAFLLICCSKKSITDKRKILVVMPKNGYEEVLNGFKEAIYEEGMNDKVDLIIQNSGITKDDFVAISKIINSSDVDIIVTVTTPVTLALYENVKNKPIVFSAVGDPISAGLAKDLKNSKKNITGVTNLSRMLTKKRMEVFKNAFPFMKKIITFYNPENVFSLLAVKDLSEISEKLNIKLEKVECLNTDNILATLKNIKKGSYDGVFIIPDPVVLSAFTDIINISNEFSMPVCVHEESYISKGATISYGIDLKEVGKHSFALVKLILQGSSPEQLPIFVPEKISLVVNNRWAKEKGYKVPNELLYLADRVVE